MPTTRERRRPKRTAMARPAGKEQSEGFCFFQRAMAPKFIVIVSLEPPSSHSSHFLAEKLMITPLVRAFSRHLAVDRHPFSKIQREMLRGSLWRLLAVAVAVAAATRAAAVLKAGQSLHRDFDDGRVVELALDREMGSRLESKDRYLFGRFDLDIRLVAGDSAGTITSFYAPPTREVARPSHGPGTRRGRVGRRRRGGG